MSDDSPVILDASPDGVAVVLLNRPEKHNAFNGDVVAALDDIFETLHANEQVRTVFIRGAGKSFSAGADLSWMKAAADYTESENRDDAMALARMLKKLHDLPQFTVAMVQGAAMGGGAGLVAACDAAIAMKDAKLRFSEVRLGLTPATISPYVVKAIGPRWAKALFATGEGFDGKFAEQIGLVQYAVENEEEMEAIAEHLTRLIFDAAPGAVADAKKLVDDVLDREIDHDLLSDTAHRIAHRRASEEGREGLSAFLEKRKPRWANG